MLMQWSRLTTATHWLTTVEAHSNSIRTLLKRSSGDERVVNPIINIDTLSLADAHLSGPFY